MQKLAAVIVPACLLLGLAISFAQQDGETATQTARGVVFHDQNGNQRFDEGEPTLADIKVSNGVDIVKTDEQGRYEISVTDDTIVFVIKPRNWQTPVSEKNLPEFYYIHKPKGSPDLRYGGVAPTGPLPKSIDFPLYPNSEPDTFKAVMFGDPQPRTQQEVDYIAHDVVEELIETEASFGVTLGDIVFDNLDLFETQAQAIALIGIPWYNVIGNHDINYDASHDVYSDETFERNFGPAYYSFDHGPVHFMVLDDVEWLVNDNGKGRYIGGLGAKQMEFIRNDLSMIPEDQLVVLMMHIPLLEVRDRLELYRLIEQRPFSMSISAHKHVHEHHYITSDDGWMGPKPHHHVVNVTVSGSWWKGAPDERGIPHTLMADGAPNGYSVVTFDGHDYAFDFRAAGRSKDYQMQIHAPEVVAVSETSATTVFANVFNGSPRWHVEMKIGKEGSWQSMELAREADPTYVATLAREKALTGKPWQDLPSPRPSTHLWKLNFPEDLATGTHLIEIKATDENGRTVKGYRTFRVNQ